MLLAEATPFDWQNLLLAYGPLGVFAAVALYFIVTYGPRLVEGHVEYMNSSKEALASLTESMKTLTENSTSHSRICEKTNRAVGHIAEAGKLAIVGPTAPDIHRHLDRAIDEVER